MPKEARKYNPVLGKGKTCVKPVAAVILYTDLIASLCEQKDNKWFGYKTSFPEICMQRAFCFTVEISRYQLTSTDCFLPALQASFRLSQHQSESCLECQDLLDFSLVITQTSGYYFVILLMLVALILYENTVLVIKTNF